MNIVRSAPRERFAIIPNAALEHEALSWKARGLLAYLLSRPPGWQTSAERLAAIAPDGRHAIRTGLAELRAAGYLVQERHQDPATGTWSTSTVIHDTPQGGDVPVDNSTEVRLPDVGSPDVGSPAVGWPDSSNKTENKTETNPPTPQHQAPPAPAGENGGEDDSKRIEALRYVWGVTEPEAREVVAVTRRDPNTRSVSARLDQEPYVRTILATIRARARDERARTAPRCPEHSTELADACRSCAAEAKAGTPPRDRRTGGMV